MGRLVQRAGKWFSSSLARGTNVVADITDMLSSGMPCLHDRANRHRLPTFDPHGGPITQSSQDRNLTLMYTPVSKSFSSRLVSYVIHEPPSERSLILVLDKILIPIASKRFHTLFQATNDCLPDWSFLLRLLTLLSMTFLNSNSRDASMPCSLR